MTWRHFFVCLCFFPLRLRIRMQGSDVGEITELDERTGTHFLKYVGTRKLVCLLFMF